MKFIASKKRFIVALILSLMVAIVGGLVFAEDQAAPPTPAAAAAVPTAPALQPDPSGANTGGAADIVGASAGAPTADDLKNLGPKEPLAAKVLDERRDERPYPGGQRHRVRLRRRHAADPG